MLPTLQQGQIVVFTSGLPVRVGDIVMFRHEGREKIKRVARQEFGKIYLLGDNPEGSTDSRTFGWVGAETVGGVLVWPRLKNRTLQ
jgi:phage repressor protein C with HTH and peptisase S24 domain